MTRGDGKSWMQGTGGGSNQSGPVSVLGNTQEIELREGREDSQSFGKDSCTR